MRHYYVYDLVKPWSNIVMAHFVWCAITKFDIVMAHFVWCAITKFDILMAHFVWCVITKFDQGLTQSYA